MNRTTLYLLLSALPLLPLFGLSVAHSQSYDQHDPGRAVDASGVIHTIATSGVIDTGNPFFQSLGSNGRACVHCHELNDGLTVIPLHIQARFFASGGRDPIFRAVDGTNSPNADQSTLWARYRASSMLLNKGLIRIGLPIPANAEFTLAVVDDPYHFASAAELSCFRRPLPSTNLNDLSAVMWDGRETVQKIIGDPTDSLIALRADLKHQALDAITGHAQAIIPPTDDQLEQIVDFELGLTTAQSYDFAAGHLNAYGALGGPVNLVQQEYYIGINDTLGADPEGAPFNPVTMTLYNAWNHNSGHGDDYGDRNKARAAVVRGQALFNTKPIAITGVKGLNDALNTSTIMGTCTTCHDSPNIGNHSVSLPLDIGLTDASRRTPDMPLYTLKNIATGATIQTTDPGRALITGKWSDIGKFKGPILRGLAARPPYFHNGFAAHLEDVVDFYETRFKISFTAREKADLVAFLKAL